MIGAIILQIVLIFFNAVFSCAELAVISVNEVKLEKMCEEGNKKAKSLMKLKSNSSKFLSTIQVAITLAGFLGSAYAADNFAGPLVKLIQKMVDIPESAIGTVTSVCVFVITLILSYFSIVFGELIPKRIAMKHSDGISLALAGILRFVSILFAPFVWILTKSTNGVLRLCHINPDEEEEEVTEEEIRLMLDTGSERGTIDSMENEMIQNIFEFDDISISEICTHRRDVAFLYLEDGIEEWKKTIGETRHTFFPICDEDADDIVGVLNADIFFRTPCNDVKTALEKASEKPFLVPEVMKADVLFNKMQESRSYFAIVIDEYGGTSGVITIHDLLEFLVGDLADKDEVCEEDIQKIDDEHYKIIGSTSLEDVEKELDVSFDADDCDTFAGYFISTLGMIPDDGTKPTVETDDLIMQAETVVDHRVEKIHVTKKIKEENENQDAD